MTSRRDVDDELAFHLRMRIERNIALGMSPEDARRDAVERFGDVDRVRSVLVAHDQRQDVRRRRTEYVAEFAQDVRFAARGLRRAPGFAIAAILTLALGIGANTAIFSIVDAVVLRPLPYARAERLVALGYGSTGEYLALRERLKTVTDLAAWTATTHPVDVDGDAARVNGVVVTTNLLPMLGVSPAIGHGFSEADGVYGSGNVVIISDGFWHRDFAAAPDIVGRRMTIDGSPFTVIGVMPAAFHYPSPDVEYWQPQVVNPKNLGLMWGLGGRQIIGRLARGATLDQAREEVKRVWPSLRRSNPLWDPGPRYGVDKTAVPLQSAIVGSASALLWMLFGATLLVLLIACVNVANLLLARAVKRERELAVRAALGGGRSRLVRQLLTESLVLATLGSIVGLTLGWLALRGLAGSISEIPRADEVSMNGRALAFALGVSIFTGLLFGIIPAIRATGAGSARSSVAGTSRRTTAGGGHLRVSGALVAGEVALAVMLATAALLLVRSFAALRSIAPGFETTNVVAARLSVPTDRFAGNPQRASTFLDDVLRRTQSLPGVRGAALVDQLPLAGPVWGIATRVQGQYEDFTRPLPMISHLQIVTPDYFAAMGIPVVRGRGFDASDRDGAAPVAVVSRSTARRFWPNDDAIGKRVGYPYASPWITIVGIVPDTRQDSLRDTSNASLYVPLAQATARFTGQMWLVARTTGDAPTTATAIRGLVRDIDRAVPVSDVRTMGAVVDESVSASRFTMLLVGSFAALALVLGAVGIYGVMSYLVGERAREMGIRIALGATRAGVMQLVLRRAALLAGAGALLGVAGALAATRALRQWLYGVSATDPFTFLAVPILFLGVGVLASAAPALRATRADPATALREE